MANGLGRGLGSLIPNKNNFQETQTGQAGQEDGNSAGGERISQVSVDNIQENPLQPRKQFTDHKLDELVESIKDFGIIQPLIATKNKDGYELIAGERRLRAAKKAGLEKVPVIIRAAKNQEKLEVALIENIQRENLNPIDLAHAYRKLVNEFQLTQEEVARKVSKARSSVTNTMRMLNLPGEIQSALIEGKLTEGHAKFLIGLESREKQMALFRKIMHNNLSVSDTDKAARKMGGTKAARIKINYADKDKEFAFREFFGAKTEIKRKGKGGQIIINFFSDEELGEIVSKIK